MSSRYPMEVWIGNEHYEIRTNEELEAALLEIDTVGGALVEVRMLRADKHSERWIGGLQVRISLTSAGSVSIFLLAIALHRTSRQIY